MAEKCGAFAQAATVKLPASASVRRRSSVDAGVSITTFPCLRKHGPSLHTTSFFKFKPPEGLTSQVAQVGGGLPGGRSAFKAWGRTRGHLLSVRLRKPQSAVLFLLVMEHSVGRPGRSPPAINRVLYRMETRCSEGQEAMLELGRHRPEYAEQEPGRLAQSRSKLKRSIKLFAVRSVRI